MHKLVRQACAVVLLGAMFVAVAALAGAPAVRTPAPGYYRMMLGDFEITALNDGTVDLHVEQLLTAISPSKLRSVMSKRYMHDPVETSVNGFLINTGAKLVLIDTGAGAMFGPTLGKLVSNLKAAGYRPEQVDEIYITHMHADHVGGLVHDGQIVFANAIVRADQREAGYWLSEKNMAAAPQDRQEGFKNAVMLLKPYVDAGKFRPFDGETELVPGIRAMPAPGHTPGHTIYSIESKGERMVAWGDLVHVASVQFPVPEVTIKFDVDPKVAMTTRKKDFADAARKHYYVALAHVSFPGIGRLRVDGRGYDWLPANFTQLNPAQ